MKADAGGQYSGIMEMPQLGVLMEVTFSLSWEMMAGPRDFLIELECDGMFDIEISCRRPHSDHV